MTILAFLVVLTIVVFVHELGHFLVARVFGVRVEAFSIGFGPELIGFNDRHGTRWRISALPFGGYVKMFGDADAASRPDAAVETMSTEERAVSLHHQPVFARAAIFAAGPLANLVFALIALSLLFMTMGQPFSPPDVGEVMPGGAAERAGFKSGDVVLKISGDTIARFEEIREVVALHPSEPLVVEIRRDGQPVRLTVTPDAREIVDRFGNSQKIGQIGIRSNGVGNVVHPPLQAVWQAGRQMVGVVDTTFTAIGQMIAGSRGTEDLGGPLRIAQMSGEAAKMGLYAVISYIAFLSVNLGIANLFPIPILDGGHLLFCILEAIRRRPLSLATQEYGFRIGLALVITLLVFVTWNDIVQLRVVDFVRGLIS